MSGPGDDRTADRLWRPHDLAKPPDSPVAAEETTADDDRGQARCPTHGRRPRAAPGDHRARGREAETAVEPVIRLQNVHFYYGAFRAVKDVTIAFEPKTHHRAHRAVRAAASRRCCARSNRMNDLIPGDARRRPDPVPRREPVRPGGRCGRGPAADRHGLPEAQPVPQVDLRQRRLRADGQRLQGQHGRARRAQPPTRRASGTTSRTSSSSRARPLRRAAAAAVHRARDRDRART